MIITRYTNDGQVINARRIKGPVNIAPGKLVPTALFLNSPQPVEMMVCDMDESHIERLGVCYTVFE